MSNIIQKTVRQTYENIDKNSELTITAQAKYVIVINIITDSIFAASYKEIERYLYIS